MDVDGMCFTDEFRMRSPVVWFCFAIVVLCALSVESKRSYPNANGEGGPIIGTIVPAIGYTNIGVGHPFLSRRQQRQQLPFTTPNPNVNPDYYDELNGFIDEDEDEDEDSDYQPFYGGFGGGNGGFAQDYEDEDEDEDDEGDSDTDNEEFGINNIAVDNVVQGRQAYINNRYIEDSYVQPQRLQYNRLRSGTRKPTKTKSTKNSSNKKKSSHGHKRKPISPLPEMNPQSALPNKKKEHEASAAMPENVVTISPLSVLQPSGDKQKLQLRPVATSTQFIATPVADLILRLSISLAKPIGQGNGTSFNVPIRIHQSAEKNVEDSKVIRADLELSQADNMSVVTVPSADKDSDEEDADVDEADEKEQTAEIPVTELSRK